MADNIDQQHWLETYKSLITISVEGFKFLALANGGAAVALLAYLGSTGSHGAANMVCPMVAFAIGVAACGLAMLCAYLTQLILFNDLSADRSGNQRHPLILWIAIALFVVSLIAFGVGSISAAMRFQGG
jgi:hypothetical protein